MRNEKAISCRPVGFCSEKQEETQEFEKSNGEMLGQLTILKEPSCPESNLQLSTIATDLYLYNHNADRIWSNGPQDEQAPIDRCNTHFHQDLAKDQS